jgi:hypothetical protein
MLETRWIAIRFPDDFDEAVPAALEPLGASNGELAVGAGLV